MTGSGDPSQTHRTGALSRLLATQPERPQVGPEALLSAVLDAATEGIVVFGADDRVLTYNDRFVEIWGIERQVLLSRDGHRVLAALVGGLKEPARFVEHVEAMAADLTARAQNSWRLLDGRVIEHETRPVLVSDRVFGRVWTYRDITTRVQAFEMLRESEDRFRNFADSAAYGIVMHREGRIVYSNDAAGRQLGCHADALHGRGFLDFIPDEDQPDLLEQARKRSSVEGAPPVHLETRVRRGDGEVRLVELGMSSLRLQEQAAVIVTMVDVTERRKAEAEALHLASHDPLTDLPNRTYFRNATDGAIATARASESHVSVVLVGLDRFKSANFLGHRMGDLVLREAANRLFNLVRSADLVARLGADEFALLLPGCDKGATLALCQQIVARLREPYQIAEENELFLSASVGCASFPLDGADTAELLRHANIALVAAKEGGRDQAVSFESGLTSEAAARVETNRFLHRSLRDRTFFLEFQPIARAHDLGITAFEALVRSKDLLGRRVPPNAFIPIAEATGLVVPMGRIVLDLALASVREMNLERASPLRVAVNASAIQLRHPGFVRDIRAGLDRHGLPASSLAVEVTETNALTDPEGTRRVLRELRDAGVSISLDDFGTGFASLDLLRSLPLDIVKIDRSFIHDIDSDDTQAAIVTSVIELAHRLKLKVVAEGVETVRQQEFLRERGCDLIQGYWLARPLSLEASLEFLRSRGRVRA